MRITDSAVVMQTVRHSDRKYISKLYTRSHGMITVIATPGRTGASKVRPSALAPLSLIDAQVTIRQNREIHRLTEAVPSIAATPGGSLVNLAISQFLNEVMIKCLRDPQPNTQIFDLLEYTVHRLSKGEAHPGFHLHFLKDLCVLLGIEPRNNYSAANPYFDCREGAFMPLNLSYPIGLTAEESLLFSQFIAESGRTLHLKRADRRSLLDSFTAYFQFHIPGFGELRSIPVVREILDD